MSLSAINAPSYKQKRIGTLEALAYPLGLSAAALEDLAQRADAMYRLAKEIVKPDGSVRRTYDAFKPLKVVHGRIKREILDHVAFPPYLTGSIKGRDYKVNAALHSRAKIVINEDISGFFPSTTWQHVFDIWHGFFGFSEAVARCLTDLTTYRGELPQGAITSPALANLVFWRREFQLQAEFAANGWTYSRYVVSTRRTHLSCHRIASDSVRLFLADTIRWQQSKQIPFRSVATIRAPTRRR